MPPRKDVPRPDISKRQPSASTPEGREQQMGEYADRLAERQLLDGTATSQVIIHYLKATSSREALEREKIHQENLKLQAQIAQAESMQSSEEMLSRVMSALRTYAGADDDDD